MSDGIEVYTDWFDYGNELHVLVVRNVPGYRQYGVVREGGRLEWLDYPPEGVAPEPTYVFHRGFATALFSSLEGYRDRNPTAEAALTDALNDTRQVRDRLLAMLERDA